MTDSAHASVLRQANDAALAKYAVLPIMLPAKPGLSETNTASHDNALRESPLNWPQPNALLTSAAES